MPFTGRACPTGHLTPLTIGMNSKDGSMSSSRVSKRIFRDVELISRDHAAREAVSWAFNFMLLLSTAGAVNQEPVSAKCPITNILGLAGHTVSVTAPCLCLYIAKAAIDDVQMNDCGCVPIKLYLQKQGAGFGPWAHSCRPLL